MFFGWLTGEASASTMWDNNAWIYFYDNGTGVEPPFLVQDFIHAVQPDARFIVMLRDPVERYYFLISNHLYLSLDTSSYLSHCGCLCICLWESRLYSDYLYFGMANKSVEDFHERVSESLQLFEVCMAERSIRSCIYNTSLNNLMPVSVTAFVIPDAYPLKCCGRAQLYSTSGFHFHVFWCST